MEVKELIPFVILLVVTSMLLGIGIVTFDKFGIAVKDSTDVVNETITIAASAGTTANDDVTALTFFGNTTHTFTPYVNTRFNWTAAGAIAVDSTNITNGNYNISYTYDKDSKSTETMSAMTTAISPIGTTWMSLIVTVAVLAIILTLVIRSFTLRGR